LHSVSLTVCSYCSSLGAERIDSVAVSFARSAVRRRARALFRFRISKNNGPDQCEPVTAYATSVRESNLRPSHSKPSARTTTRTSLPLYRRTSVDPGAGRRGSRRGPDVPGGVELQLPVGEKP